MINKIPIGIKSCSKNLERRQAIEHTWLSKLDDKFFPMFLVGRIGQPSELVGNVLYLDCEDTYQGLSGKLKQFYKWALENTNASHIWTCDDDSYINTNLFNVFEEYKNYDYCGSFIYGLEKKENYVSGYTSGCGVCVSREAASICVEYLPHTTPLGQYDDVFVGNVLNTNMQNLKKFHIPNVYPWSFCNYIPNLMIGHYVHKMDGGAPNIRSFDESMKIMHSYYTETNFNEILQKQRGNNMEHFYKNIQGWFGFESVYDDLIREIPVGGSFVEIGVWKGTSLSYFIVENINKNKNIKIYAVDTWLGSAEHQAGSWAHDPAIANNTLFEVFINNTIQVKDKFNILKMTSEQASKQFEDNSLDAVFIDACHEYDCVKQDIDCWYPKLKQNAYLSGHDYGGYFVGVTNAVNEFAKKNNLYVNTKDGCWIIQKK
jgi:hypothetical protein